MYLIFIVVFSAHSPCKMQSVIDASIIIAHKHMEDVPVPKRDYFRFFLKYPLPLLNSRASRLTKQQNCQVKIMLRTYSH